MEGIQQAFLVTTILVTLLKTTESCSTKEFTLYDPNNPDAQETCKRCQTCPPGQGLEKQCGSRVPYGTSTGCKPCVYSETYSEKNDTSYCKPCNQCGFKIELQKCTPWQNSRCAAACRSGYYMDPVVDECKVVPENKTANAILASRNSTSEPSGIMVTSDTKSPGTTSPTVSVSGITTSNSTSADSSIRVRSTPLEHNQSTDQESKDFKEIKIIVGCTCGAAFTVIIILAAYFGMTKYSSKSNIHNFDHHVIINQSGNKLQLKEQLPPDRPPRKHYSQETLQDNVTSEVCAHKNGRELDVQQIPEDLRISAMEKLRDHDNQLMIFYVGDKLDFPETIQVKTWYSVGLALNVDAGVLNGIKTCYRSQESPTHSVMIPHFKTLGEKEPSMREFVDALLQCKRYDVAFKICHWPLQLNDGSLEK